MPKLNWIGKDEVLEKQYTYDIDEHKKQLSLECSDEKLVLY